MSPPLGGIPQIKLGIFMKTSNTGKWPRPVGSEYHLVRVVNFRNIYTMESVFSKVVNTEEETDLYF